MIMKWARWQKGQAEDYLGTASEKEFLDLDSAIRDAEQRGSHLESERLKKKWAQERFARGFEEYLRGGKAPVPTLQSVFQRFTHWLKQIYRDVTGVGIRPTKDVEAVMARMVSTDDELSAAQFRNREIKKQAANAYSPAGLQVSLEDRTGQPSDYSSSAAEEDVTSKSENSLPIKAENNKVADPMRQEVQLEHPDDLSRNPQKSEKKQPTDIVAILFSFSCESSCSDSYLSRQEWIVGFSSAWHLFKAGTRI